MSTAARSKPIVGAKPYFFEEEDAMLKDIQEVLQSGGLTQGKHLKAFEQSFREYVGAEYALGVNSGGTGLTLALEALDVKDKEVIVPTNTFVASASAVYQAGGKVVFADIDPQTLSLSVEAVKSLITDKTAGVMMVHMFGLMSAELEGLKDLCAKRGIFLLEDAAHAHGASFRGTKAGVIGDAACFSFYATKVITTGEGGIVTTNNADVADKVNQLRGHGKSLDKPVFELISNNYRLAEIPAILGVYQMKHLEENIKHRNRIADLYIEHLKDEESCTLLNPDQDSQHSYWRFPLYLDKAVNRASLQKFMAEEYNVRLTWMYEPLCHLQPLFQQTNHHKEGDFPVAEDCMRRLINLPTHLDVAEEDVSYVCDALNEGLKKCR